MPSRLVAVAVFVSISALTTFAGTHSETVSTATVFPAIPQYF
jgi:hypothetical protein